MIERKREREMGEGLLKSLFITFNGLPVAIRPDFIGTAAAFYLHLLMFFVCFF